MLKRAIILAGGLGTRLRPLTLTTPKPLVPVQGRALLEHVFDILRTHGITQATLCIGHMADAIKAYVGDGSKFGLTIDYVIETEPLGTAGPLALIKKPNETVMVLNADNLHNIDLHDVYKKHKASGAIITDMLTRVDDPSAYGVAKLEGNTIIEFVEKPKKEDAPSHFINSGYYLFEPSVWDHLPKGKAMLEKDVFPTIAKTGKMNAYLGTGQWFDTGTPESYKRVCDEWKPVKKK